MNCFRYLGFKSLAEVDRLTIPEYELLMEAYQLNQVDEDRKIHWQAFLNFAVQAKKKAGKHKTRPVYNSFGKFYDYEKELTNVRKKKKQINKFSGIGNLLKKGGA